MLVIKNIIPSLLKGSLETSDHFTKRTLFLQAPLLSNPNKFKNGLNPWDEKIELEGTQKRMDWPAYNERIHLPDGTHRPAYVCHVRDNVKYTSKKMWHVANLVRGLSVDEALKQLDFINKKGAFIAAEVIREAQELAVKEHCVEYRSNLWVAESFATKGMVMKGVRRHARMRMSLVRYEYMHYFVRLEEGSPPPDYWSAWNAPGFNPSRMLEEWVKQHRKKFVPLE